MGDYPVSNKENTKAFYKKDLVLLGYMYFKRKMKQRLIGNYLGNSNVYFITRVCSHQFHHINALFLSKIHTYIILDGRSLT